MWPYRYAYDVLLVTLILNIYGFVGLAPFFFLAKLPFLAFFKYRKECSHIDMLMTFPDDTDGAHPMLFTESGYICMPKF